MALGPVNGATVSLVGRDSHDYYGHSALAFFVYHPSRLPFHCGEKKAGSLVATKAL